jgi:hypothetical protein
VKKRGIEETHVGVCRILPHGLNILLEHMVIGASFEFARRLEPVEQSTKVLDLSHVSITTRKWKRRPMQTDGSEFSNDL